MKILYISHSFGAWGSHDQIWDRNIRDSLIFQGHELIGPPYDQNQAHVECSQDASGTARARYSQRLLEFVNSVLKKGSLDLIFTYFDNRNILPETLDDIRRFGIPTVNFFCNAAHEFYKIDQVAAHFDYCIVPEREAIQKYVDAGARPIHLQMAANPRFYRPIPLPVIYDVVFVGTKYLNREEHLLRLYNAGLNVHVFGSMWPLYRPNLQGLPIHQYPRKIAAKLTWHPRMYLRQRKGSQLPTNCYHSPIGDDEMVAVLNQSKIVLGLSDVVDPDGKVMRHIRLRDFEAPMCGAFYLTGYQEELQEYYQIGKEIECYDTVEELAQKALYYANHDTERLAIARAGFERARRDHTWENRFQSLFAHIGLESSLSKP